MNRKNLYMTHIYDFTNYEYARKVSQVIFTHRNRIKKLFYTISMYLPLMSTVPPKAFQFVTFTCDDNKNTELFGLGLKPVK